MDYEKLMNKKNSKGKDAVDLLNEATELMDNDDFRGAIDLLSEAVDLCGHPRLYFNLGYCYYQLKDFKDAVEDFENSLANDRGNDLLKHERQRLFLYLGIIYEKNKDNDKAIEAYKNSADWGYEGALAKLENLGVSYVPEEPSVESYKPEASRENQKEQSTQQKQRAQQKLREQKNKSVPKASSAAKDKKKRFGLMLPTVVGFIIGVILILIVSNLPKNEERGYVVKKPPKVTATVTYDAAQLRSEPYNNSLILKILYNGNVVNVTGEKLGEWIPVEYEGISGWVSSELIELK